MDVIQTSNKQVDKHGPGLHGFSPGNPGSGQPATFFSNLWADDVQQEIINTMAAAGIAPAAATPTQLRNAINMLIRNQTAVIGIATRTGTDAYNADLTPDITALGAAQNGLRLCLRATAANTTAAPTLAVDAVAAKQIVKLNNAALAPGEISGAGHWLDFIFDQPNDRFVLLNPAPSGLGAPVGSLLVHSGTSAPTGYIKANGSLLSRTAFSSLFAFANAEGLVSEATWSAGSEGRFSVGDGSTTFRIPDFRGGFARAWDDGRGIDISRAFGTLQLDAMQGHHHTARNASLSVGSGTSFFEINPTYAVNGGNVGIAGPITDGVNGTPRIASENRPRNISSLFCIKF